MKSVRQKNFDWHLWRQGGVGSSDAPAVMKASPWCTPFKLWQIKTKRREPDPSNFQMIRGLKLEPKARERYQDMTGMPMPLDYVEHDKIGFLRASVDGINHKAGKVLEIKCPGRADHATAVKGEIPAKYIWQCVHLLMVTGFDALDYFSFDGDNGVIVPFGRDKKLEKKLFPEEEKFWECVQTDVSPIRRELAMKNETKKEQSPFTAREMIEIMQEAKRLGITMIKFQGNEIAFEPQRESNHEATSGGPFIQMRSGRDLCEIHNEEFVDGIYGPYCKSCYIERQESKKRHRVEPFRTRRNQGDR